MNPSYFVIATLHNKCVCLAPNNIDLRDQQAVDVPRDSPSHVCSYGRVAIVASGWSNLGEEDTIFRLIALDGRDEPVDWLFTDNLCVFTMAGRMQEPVQELAPASASSSSESVEQACLETDEE